MFESPFVRFYVFKLKNLSSGSEDIIEDDIAEEDFYQFYDSDILDLLERGETSAENEARNIIRNAESYNRTDKIFTEEDFYANASSFFLSEHDENAYNYILWDLDNKTAYSSFDIRNL